MTRTSKKCENELSKNQASDMDFVPPVKEGAVGEAVLAADELAASSIPATPKDADLAGGRTTDTRCGRAGPA